MLSAPGWFCKNARNCCSRLRAICAVLPARPVFLTLAEMGYRQPYEVLRILHGPGLPVTEEVLDTVHLHHEIGHEDAAVQLAMYFHEDPLNASVPIVSLNGEMLIGNVVHETFHEEGRHLRFEDAPLRHVG